MGCVGTLGLPYTWNAKGLLPRVISLFSFSRVYMFLVFLMILRIDSPRRAASYVSRPSEESLRYSHLPWLLFGRFLTLNSFGCPCLSLTLMAAWGVQCARLMPWTNWPVRSRSLLCCLGRPRAAKPAFMACSGADFCRTLRVSGSVVLDILCQMSPLLHALVDGDDVKKRRAQICDQIQRLIKFLQDYAGRRVRQTRTPNISAERKFTNLIKLKQYRVKRTVSPSTPTCWRQASSFRSRRNTISHRETKTQQTKERRKTREMCSLCWSVLCQVMWHSSSCS